MGKEKAVASEPEELPRSIVRRVVKDKLSDVSTDGGDVILHKEALLAFSESARIFIHYLSATANDICTESKRQIINAEDVLNALEEIEFSEFVEPLRASLEEFRKKTAGKRAGSAKAKEENKKQKALEETITKNGRDEGKEEDEEDNAGEDQEKGSEDNEAEDLDQDQASEDDGAEDEDQDQPSEDDGAEDQDQASEDDGAEDQDEDQASEENEDDSNDN